MEEDNQIVEYKKSFFGRIKEWIFKLFSGKEKTKEIESVSNIQKEQENSATNEVKEEQSEKEKFMELYQSAQDGEIELETLDDSILYKMEVMAAEEVDLLDEKIKEAETKTNNILKNAEVYRKELEMLTTRA